MCTRGDQLECTVRPTTWGSWLLPADVDDGLVTKNLADASRVVEPQLHPRFLLDVTNSGLDRDSGTCTVRAMPECWKSFDGECS